jgi:hypothetical protein
VSALQYLHTHFLRRIAVYFSKQTPQHSGSVELVPVACLLFFDLVVIVLFFEEINNNQIFIENI